VGRTLDRLCGLNGPRWVYDSDELGVIRHNVMTILTHHAAMARYGRMLLARNQGRAWRRNASIGKPSCSRRHPGLAQSFEKPLPVDRPRKGRSRRWSLAVNARMRCNNWSSVV